MVESVRAKSDSQNSELKSLKEEVRKIEEAIKNLISQRQKAAGPQS